MASLDRHLLPVMMEAGCRVSLATDDPAYFNTSQANEYRIAAGLAGIGRSELDLVTRNALATALCGPDAKREIARHVAPC